MKQTKQLELIDELIAAKAVWRGDREKAVSSLEAGIKKFSTKSDAEQHLRDGHWIYVQSHGQLRPRGATIANGKIWKAAHVYTEGATWILEIVPLHTSPGCA